MREAILDAEVGDDVFGEDSTVKRLEAIAAGRMGKGRLNTKPFPTKW